MSIKNSLYKTLDSITFHKGFACHVNGFKVLFPAKWFRYFENDYEKENILFLKEQVKPGMTVVDIGAHLGLLSSICAQLTGKTGRIYCFEPTPSTFSVLKEVVRLNNAQDIIFPQNKAVSNFTGQLDFFIDENEGSNANSLVGRDDKNRSTRKMEVITLDDFLRVQQIDKLDLVKIDAEGSELDVLTGARKSLERFRPRIILALHPQLIRNNNQSLSAIYDLLVELNYEVFFKSQPLSKESFCSTEDLFDVHLLPKNRL